MGSFWSETKEMHCFERLNCFQPITIQRKWQEKVAWKLTQCHQLMLCSADGINELLIPQSIIDIIKSMSEDSDCKIMVTRNSTVQEYKCIDYNLYDKPFCRKFWRITNDRVVPWVFVSIFGTNACE